MAGCNEPNGNIKEVLVETLNNLLSVQSDVRLQAEEHIKVLEVTEGNAVFYYLLIHILFTILCLVGII